LDDVASARRLSESATLGSGKEQPVRVLDFVFLDFFFLDFVFEATTKRMT
jgi:hypothetical protein